MASSSSTCTLVLRMPAPQTFQPTARTNRLGGLLATSPKALASCADSTTPLTFTRVGRPNTVPAVGFANASIFASWNGATEVSYWSFATGSDTDALDQGDVLARTGFETNSTFSSDGGTYIAAVALDSNQDCLAVSSLYFAGNGSKSEVHGSCDSVKGLNEAAEPSYLKGSADDEDHDSSAAMAHLSFTWGGVLFLGAGTAVLLMM